MAENTLSSESYPTRMLSDLRELYTGGHLVDTTLTLAESGSTFYAHRCVLVAASPFFKSLLHQSKLSEDITIKSVSAESFSRLLDFLYSGSLRLTGESVWQVLAASTQLQVTEVTELCQKYISENDQGEVPSLDVVGIAGVKVEPQDGSTEEDMTPNTRRTRGRRIKNTPKVKTLTSTPSGRKGRKSVVTIDDVDISEEFNPPKVPEEMREKLIKVLKPNKSEKKRRKNRKLSSPPPPSPPQEVDDQEDDVDNDLDYFPQPVTDTPPAGRGRKRGRPRKGEEITTPRKKVKSEKVSPKKATIPGRGRPRKGEVAPAWEDHSISIKDFPPLKCQVCAYRFYHLGALHLHLRKHRILVYKQCLLDRHNAMKRLATFQLLQKQTVAMSTTDSTGSGSQYNCTRCNKTFLSYNRGLAHIVKTHSRKRPCNRCTKTTNHTRKIWLLRGCRRNLRAPVKSCDICYRQFKHESLLNAHMESHDKDAMRPPCLKCRHCKRSFTDRQVFITHLFGHGLNDKEVDLEFTEPGRVPLRMSVKKVERDDSNPLPFKCPNCMHRYKKMSDLNVHMINRHNLRVLPPHKTQVKKVRCEEDGGNCNAVFSRMQDLRKHLHNDHPDAAYDCYLCKYSTPVKRLLRLHLKYKHTDMDDRTCQECNKHFRKRYHFRIHMVSKHGHEDPDVKVFTCDVDGCDYKTYARYVLDIHMKKHNKEKNFACTICGRKLKSEKAVEKHVSKVHMGIRPFICDICGASYGEEHELKMHIVRHNDVKQFQCEHCDYATHDKGNFQSHLLQRHGVQLRKDMTIYTCDRCGYSTWVRARYQEHANSHDNVRNYNCPVCNKTFITKTTLNQHVKWMHSQDRIKCPFCPYQAPVRKQLTMHIRTQHTHRDHKPFGCPYCEFKCRSSQNCRKHVMQRHKDREVKWVKLYNISADDVHRAMNTVINDPIPDHDPNPPPPRKPKSTPSKKVYTPPHALETITTYNHDNLNTAYHSLPPVAPMLEIKHDHDMKVGIEYMSLEGVATGDPSHMMSWQDDVGIQLYPGHNSAVPVPLNLHALQVSHHGNHSTHPNNHTGAHTPNLSNHTGAHTPNLTNQAGPHTPNLGNQAGAHTPNANNQTGAHTSSQIISPSKTLDQIHRHGHEMIENHPQTVNSNHSGVIHHHPPGAPPMPLNVAQAAMLQIPLYTRSHDSQSDPVYLSQSIAESVSQSTRTVQQVSLMDGGGGVVQSLSSLPSRPVMSQISDQSLQPVISHGGAGEDRPLNNVYMYHLANQRFHQDCLIKK